MRGENLDLDDRAIKDENIEKRKINQDHSIRSKSRGGGPCKKPECFPGDLVFVKGQGSKHEVRSPFIVTGEGRKDGEVAVRKVLHSNSESAKQPAFSADQKVVDKKFLFMKSTPSRIDRSEYWQEDDEFDEWYADSCEAIEWGQEHDTVDVEVIPVWDPTPSYEEEDEYAIMATTGWAESQHIVHVLPLPVVDNHDLDGVILNQVVEPRKGDRILIHNDATKTWMLVRLTSEKIKYYRNTGPYYNFIADDGGAGGQYLWPGGLWSHVTPEFERRLDLENIVPLFPDAAEMAQYDGGVTPESLTSGESEMCQDDAFLEITDDIDPMSPREVRQIRRWLARDDQTRGDENLGQGQCDLHGDGE